MEPSPSPSLTNCYCALKVKGQNISFTREVGLGVNYLRTTHEFWLTDLTVGQPLTLMVYWEITNQNPQFASVSNLTEIFRTSETVVSSGTSIYQFVGIPQNSQVIITLTGSFDPTFGMVFAYQPIFSD